MITAATFAVLAFAGSVITTVQAVLTTLFRRRRPFVQSLPEQAFRPGDSFISILKPVCGVDAGLEENLLSFVSLEGLQYEVILSVEGDDDPAMPILRTAVRDHPDVFRLVVGPKRNRGGVINRKVERLIDAARVARGDIFVVSDSNVRVAPGDVAATVEHFRDPRTGCVSNLFTGSDGETAGGIVESLHLLTFVIPGTVLAATARVPCVVGKSMAISRAVLDAIGGFEAFRFVLAEDQAIGLAVRQAGYEVVVSPVAVRNVIGRRTLRRAVDRQIRWNKIRYSFSRRLYVAELILNPLPFAIIAVLAGAPPWLALAVLMLRFAQAAILARATRILAPIWAMPLLDAAMLYAWFVPFFSNEVEWRGYRARLGRNTELIQAA